MHEQGITPYGSMQIMVDLSRTPPSGGFFMPGKGADAMTKQKKRQKCDIYSRVVGFITPTSHWNRGKKEEWKDRITYDKQLKG